MPIASKAAAMGGEALIAMADGGVRVAIAMSAGPIVINPAGHETLVGIDDAVLEELMRRARPFLDVLNDEDRYEDDQAVARWRKRVPFVRLKLIERGLMRSDAPRGVWAISELGRRHLASARS